MSDALARQAAEVGRAAREAERNVVRSAYLSGRAAGRWQHILEGAASAMRLSFQREPKIYDYRRRHAQALKRDWEAISRDMWQAVERAERARAEQLARNQQRLFDPEDAAKSA